MVQRPAVAPRRLGGGQTWSKHGPQTGPCLWSVWVPPSDEEQGHTGLIIKIYIRYREVPYHAVQAHDD